MRQEVNLYSEEFKRGDQTFSARQVAIYSAAFLVVLLAIEVAVFWQYRNESQQLAKQTVAQQVIADRLNRLKASRPLSQRTTLEADIASATLRLARMEELLAIMSGKKLGNASGFSQHLVAMAQRSNANVALTDFGLIDGGEYVEFGGWTRIPAAVPEYLQQLREEDSFKTARYGVLVIEKDQNQSSKLRFKLGKIEAGIK